MNRESILIRPESSNDFDNVEKLTAEAFGPGRFTRSAFRLREGIAHEGLLSFVAEYQGILIGSVRQTQIHISEIPAILLGPLVVEPKFKGYGAGKLLMQKAVEAARQQGHSWVVLVGDLPYYEQFGFNRVKRGHILFPAPVDPDRILVCALRNGEATANLSGTARRITPLERLECNP